ncbi:MAG: trypsin-like peptidase domain-containing protein [Chloroflexi bacterium]|nr:trypsin-like peptidase domain-containing protein [Chloroflexota bacterium]
MHDFLWAVLCMSVVRASWFAGCFILFLLVAAMIASHDWTDHANALNPAGHLPEPSAPGKVFHAFGHEPLYVPGEEPDVTAQNVIGSDDRVRITATDKYPWRAISWLGLYNEWGERSGHCSGTFISPDAILTAAHCLYDKDYGWTADIVVVPGKDGGTDPFGHVWAASWWVPDAWIDTGGHPAFDWGVIMLDNPSLGEATGWFTLAMLSTATLSLSDAFPAVVGYPGDKYPDATMWGSFQSAFATVGEAVLFYEIDTAPGMSGSAVWLANVDRPDHLGFIVGVHTLGLAEVTGANAGLRINEFLVADLNEGCRQMGCSFEFVIEEDATLPPPAPTPTHCHPNSLSPPSGRQPRRRLVWVDKRPEPPRDETQPGRDAPPYGDGPSQR